MPIYLVKGRALRILVASECEFRPNGLKAIAHGACTKLMGSKSGSGDSPMANCTSLLSGIASGLLIWHSTVISFDRSSFFAIVSVMNSGFFTTCSSRLSGAVEMHLMRRRTTPGFFGRTTVSAGGDQAWAGPFVPPSNDDGLLGLG
jgi:hypothetical protein